IWLVPFAEFTADEAGNIPEFITEVTSGDNAVYAESLVLTRATAGNKAKAQSIRAVLGHQFHRVNNVPLAFAHFLAVLVEHHAMQVDSFKRYFIGNVEAEHNHASNPSVEKVGTGFHQVGWEET